MPNAEILEKADKLLTAVEDLTTEVSQLTGRVNRNRVMVIALAVALVVMTITSTLAGLAFQRANATNSHALRNSCQSRNDARANNRLLWHDVLDAVFVAPPTASDAQRKNTEDLKIRIQGFVDKNSEPIDCSVPLKELNK